MDIAARMESNGESMRVHISNTTAEKLKDNNDFELISRGEVYIQGMGNTETFWLEKNILV